MANSMIANGKVTKITFGILALSLVAAAGSAIALRTVPAAQAAPAIDAAAPLTISRKPASDLSAAPGIRLAKVSNTDGISCFRASRTLPSEGRTISETFCTH